MTICLLLLLGAPPAVVDSVFARQAAVAAQVCSLSYHAEYRYLEENYRDRRRLDLRCSRRVYMHGYGEQRHEFERVVVDGRELRGAEMQRELHDLESKGLIVSKTRMPFMLETRNEYRYRALGTERVQGRDVWVVGFEPVRPSGRTVRGRGYFLRQGWDAVRIEFVPARLPFVVRDMALALDYGRVGEYWMPERFTLDLDLRLDFLVTMLDRHIEIEDIYSDYRLNGVVVGGSE